MNAAQCRMARAAKELTVRALAELAGVSHDTIVRIEGGQVLKPATLSKVKAALEKMGLEFTNGGQPGVRIVHPDGAALQANAGPGQPID